VHVAMYMRDSGLSPLRCKSYSKLVVYEDVSGSPKTCVTAKYTLVLDFVQQIYNDVRLVDTESVEVFPY